MICWAHCPLYSPFCPKVSLHCTYLLSCPQTHHVFPSWPFHMLTSQVRTLPQTPLLFAAYCSLLLYNKLTKFSKLNQQIFISQFLWGRHLETAHLGGSGLGFSWAYSKAAGHGCCPLTTCLGMEKPLPRWLSDGSRSLLLATKLAMWAQQHTNWLLENKWLKREQGQKPCVFYDLVLEWNTITLAIFFHLTWSLTPV